MSRSVSVILHQGAEVSSVRRCVEGILCQDFEGGVELIVVCEEPTGEAAELALRLIRDAGLTASVLATGGVRGPHSTTAAGGWLLEGVRCATGSLIAPLTSCDWWSSPYYLRTCAGRLADRRELVAWAVNSIVHDVTTCRFNPRGWPFSEKKTLLDAEDVLATYPFSNLSGVVIRRSVLASLPAELYLLEHFERFVLAASARLGMVGFSPQYGLIERAGRTRTSRHMEDGVAFYASLLTSFSFFDHILGGGMRDTVKRLQATVLADLNAAHQSRAAS